MTNSIRTTRLLEGTDGLARALADLHSLHISEGERLARLTDALAESEQLCENLQGALVNSRRIGAAIGIVMALMKVTEADAFAMLVRISQNKNTKVRLIADEIVLTGTF